MRSGPRKPSTGTLFIDAVTAEVLLEVTANEHGNTLVAFHLYDCNGKLVAESDGLRDCSAGQEVRDEQDERLLLIPNNPESHIEYRLYSQQGVLLTCSDGARTQLFGGVRVEARNTKLQPPARRSGSAWRAGSTPQTQSERLALKP